MFLFNLLERLVHLRDAQGQSSSVDNFQLRFSYLTDLESYETDSILKAAVEGVNLQKQSTSQLDSIHKLADAAASKECRLMNIQLD